MKTLTHAERRAWKRSCKASGQASNALVFLKSRAFAIAKGKLLAGEPWREFYMTFRLDRLTGKGKESLPKLPKGETIQPKWLQDVLPKEFLWGEYDESPAMKHRHALVTVKHDSGAGWPGTHKNVCVWYELANGYAVGWNENPARGWSFPVVKLKKDC